MDDKFLRSAFHALDAKEPPSFEAVASQGGARRLRKARAGLVVLAFIAVAVAAPLLRPAQSPEMAIALVQPPTTDWLLQTPDPEWIADLDRQSEPEGE